ncbi:MFS transporter [Microbacterium sp. 1.5R]|uniref:MFS transporter n=1 Tax=Microbacterium sp. 1.5R TaxID=1916917 RepID=UPI0011A70C0A|nr:MFS transporter [Microbacterium sp. 1.5R]
MRGASHPRAVVAALATVGICASLMQTLLIPVQSRLPALLDAPASETSWAISVTLLASALSAPISGRLGDIYGRRRVALVLMTLMTVGSVVGALPFDVGALIAARALQGLALGVIPLGISILRDSLPPDRLGTAIAVLSATLGIGGAIGLPAGSLLVEMSGWRALFWAAAVLGIVSCSLIFFVVPHDTAQEGGRFDLPGTLLFSLALTAGLIGIGRATEWGWASPAVLALIGGSLVGLALWVALELRTTAPLIDIRAAVGRTVGRANTAAVALGFALFASTVVFPQVLQVPAAAGGPGLSLLHTSVVLAPSGIAMLLTAPLAGRLERRLGPRALLLTGAGLIATVYLSCLIPGLNMPRILLGNVAIGVGIGFGYSALPALIVGSVPARDTGAAIGLNALMRTVGAAVAASLISGIVARSARRVDGIAVPDDGSLMLALAISLTASVLCVLSALWIPRPAGRKDAGG